MSATRRHATLKLYYSNRIWWNFFIFAIVLWNNKYTYIHTYFILALLCNNYHIYIGPISHIYLCIYIFIIYDMFYNIYHIYYVISIHYICDVIEVGKYIGKKDHLNIALWHFWGFFVCLFCLFGSTPSSIQGLILVLCSETTPDRYKWPYGKPRIEPGSVTSKANTIPTVISLWPQHGFL